MIPDDDEVPIVVGANGGASMAREKWPLFIEEVQKNSDGDVDLNLRLASTIPSTSKDNNKDFHLGMRDQVE